MRGPTSAEFVRLHDVACYSRPPDPRKVVGAGFSIWNSMTVAPKGTTSISLPIVATWTSDEDRVPYPDKPARPLFPKPGDYEFRLYYLCDQHKFDSPNTISAAVTVRVREPEGKDREIVEQLQKDNGLFARVMNPFWVHVGDEYIPKLKVLLHDHPNSSYAPYFRLALARNYLAVGTGLTSRVKMAMAADELEKSIESEFAFAPFAQLRLMECDLGYNRANRDFLARKYWHAQEWHHETNQTDVISPPPKKQEGDPVDGSPHPSR